MMERDGSGKLQRASSYGLNSTIADLGLLDWSEN